MNIYRNDPGNGGSGNTVSFSINGFWYHVSMPNAKSGMDQNGDIWTTEGNYFVHEHGVLKVYINYLDLKLQQ